MRVLLISSLCSETKYSFIYKSRIEPMLDSNQKFLLALAKGISVHSDVTLDCISSLPISYRCFSQRMIKPEFEEVNGVSYSYCGCLNFPIVRTIMVSFYIKRFVNRYLKEHKGEKIVVLCDGLLPEATDIINTLKKKGIQAIALVTDIPSIATDMSTRTGLRKRLGQFYGRRANELLKRFDKYVFLTEQMNDVCNPNQRPYMIMECIVDATNEIITEQKYSTPTVLYAGKYYRECGVITLAKAAALLKGKCRILMYGGHGNCDDELEKLRRDTDNLEINGIVTLAEILAIEKKCAILINPRPVTEEFTKYSFPSKTAEYMMSGIPVLSHKLPGIPDEYDSYLSYIYEDTPESIAAAISKLLETDSKELDALGDAGAEFIKTNKNCFKQAQRLMDFIQGDRL